MSKLKLTYFDFDGGRGEPARLALHIGGIPFEDERISPKDWPQFRDRTPFQAMPTLEVDGKVVTQSNSINRYVGKLAGLYPKDDFQALLCDEVMDAAEDIGTRIAQHDRPARGRQEEGARRTRCRAHHALPGAAAGAAEGSGWGIFRRQAPHGGRPQDLHAGSMAPVRSARPYSEGPRRHASRL